MAGVISERSKQNVVKATREHVTASALAESSRAPKGQPAPRKSTLALRRTSLASVAMIGLTVIAASETEQLSLWIWQSAFRSDTS